MYCPVHPRLRGELYVYIMIIYTILGSSPLARGTLIQGKSFDNVFRFIPACAGNSYNGGWGWPVVTVHPRLRGELPQMW